MEDKQKVYIKGDSKRGKEVIKLLTDLGASNPNHYYGSDTGFYYINSNGEIAYTSTKRSAVYSLLRESYKKIELPRGMPQYRDSYFYINTDGLIVEEIWYNKQIDKSRYEFGNCFVGIDEAKMVRDKIRKMLNKHK